MIVRDRMIKSSIRSALKENQIVIVEGIAGCGKSFTCKELAKSSYNLSSDDGRAAQLANIIPSDALEGRYPHLVDEWLLAPALVKYVLGKRLDLPNGALLFASSISLDKYYRHQIEKCNWMKIIRLNTMSSFESGDSYSYITLHRLFNVRKSIVLGAKQASIQELSYLLFRGGFPQAVNTSDEDPLIKVMKANTCVQNIIDNGLDQIDGVKRSKSKLSLIMRALTIHQGEHVTNKKICEEIESFGEETISRETLSSYFKVLQDLFLVEDCPAWIPSLKGSTKVNKSAARYFSDPAIAAHNLNIVPESLKYYPRAFECLFRTMCMRDLRIYAQAFNGKVYHFSTRNGLKCDAVVQLDDGRYGLIEFTLGSDEEIEVEARMLKEVAGKIDIEKMGAPSFMMVLTGLSSVTYQRKDGVYVVPLLTLGQ